MVIQGAPPPLLFRNLLGRRAPCALLALYSQLIDWICDNFGNVMKNQGIDWKLLQQLSHEHISELLRRVSVFWWCFFGRELWFGCVEISKKSLRVITHVLYQCFRFAMGDCVYVQISFVLFDFVVLHARCPWICYHKRSPEFFFGRRPKPFWHWMMYMLVPTWFVLIAPRSTLPQDCRHLFLRWWCRCLSQDNQHILLQGTRRVRSSRSGPQSQTTGTPWCPYPARGDVWWGGL